MKMIDIIYCDYCSYKLILRNLEECNLIKIDKNKFKCPSCGRLIFSKKIKDVQKELNNKIKKEKYLEEYKNWIAETVAEKKDGE